MRVKCPSCDQSTDATMATCQFCGSAVPQLDLEAMARRAKPLDGPQPPKKDAPISPASEDEGGEDPNANTKTLVVAAALGGFVMVIVLAGWIGSALVGAATKVGESEEVQKLERDVNDALDKLPKRR